jgi:hypothetical protein
LPPGQPQGAARDSTREQEQCPENRSRVGHATRR